MPDQLYLSYWTRGFTEHKVFQVLDRLLRTFPISRLEPRALLQVRAIDFAEPLLLERDFGQTIEIDEIVEAAKWFRGRDCAYEVESNWDLWQFREDWALAPTPARLACYGPLFPSEYGEQIRIELGPDSQFLPQLEISPALAPVRHNIRSLLHLVRDLDDAFEVEKRQLWSEAGGNFAELLQEALRE